MFARDVNREMEKSLEGIRDIILTKSSRSDNIFMIPYGRKLYRAFIIIEANLMAQSEENIKSSIQSELSNFYNDITEVRDPIESVIYHKIHSCNEAIKRAWVILISEYDVKKDPEWEGDPKEVFTNFPTRDICSDAAKLEHNKEKNYIFNFFYNLLPNDPVEPDKKDLDYIDRYSELSLPKEQVIARNLLLDSISKLAHYCGNDTDPQSSYVYEYPRTLPYNTVNEDLDVVDKSKPAYYDKPEIDTYPVDSEEYNNTHFILPSLYDLIIWIYPT